MSDPRKDGGKRAELEKWLVHMNPANAEAFRLAYQGASALDAAQGPGKSGSPAATTTVIAAAHKEADRESQEAHQDSADAKLMQTSADAMQILAEWLQEWSSHELLFSNKPVGRPSESTGLKLLDKQLARAATALDARGTLEGVNRATTEWRALRGDLEPLLTGTAKHFESHKGAADHPHAKEALKFIASARSSLGVIDSTLQEVRVARQYDHDVEKVPIADVGEAIHARAAKKEWDPGMQALKTAMGASTKLADAMGTAHAKSVGRIMEIYFSVDDFKDKLTAFKQANLLDQAATVADLGAFLLKQTKEACEAYNEAAKLLAHQAGKESIVAALEKRGAKIRVLGQAVAIYEAAKALYALGKAIEKGDWGEIGKALGETVEKGVDVAIAFGAVEEGAQGPIAVISITIWAEAEALSMIAETSKWGRAHERLKATNRLVNDLKTLVPWGKRVVVASNSMAAEELGSPAYEQLQKRFQAALPSLKQGFQFLHQQTQVDQITYLGHYSDLQGLLSGDAQDAIAGQGKYRIDDGTETALPHEIAQAYSDRFSAIVAGVRQLAQRADKKWGADAEFDPNDA